MDFLPKDPAILVSSVNMLLRDEENGGISQLIRLSMSTA